MISSSSNSDTRANSRGLPSPAPNHSPIPYPQPTRRRRRISPSSDAPSDPVIGQVTQNGKFKCIDVGCDDLTFGRQADFKRHYENVHAPKKIEYFCPVEGCHRSRKPQGGRSKGRSFNNRRDKMEEHVRTVHKDGEEWKKPTKEGEEGFENRIKGKRPRISSEHNI